MKLYVILLLCSTAVFGEKKINLEDIERDNLRSEAQSSEGDNVQPEEQQYGSSSGGSGAHLQYNTEPRVIGNQHQLEQIKYVPRPETYNQASYADQQSQRPQQFYQNAYQGEEYQSQKSAPQVSYQLPQGLTYQSEVPIGNHIQSYQQRIATQKFTQAIGKGGDYSRAAGKQLVHYTNSGADQDSKNQLQPLFHQLASQAVQNARIPAYTVSSSGNQESKVSYQSQPQVQYVFEPQYVLPSAPTYSSKASQEIAYANQQTYLPSSAQQQVYPEVPYNPSGLQTYYIQPQLTTQYYQEPAYFPASALSGNSPSYPQPETYYVPSTLSQQIPTQINKRPTTSHGVAQSFGKIPQEPRFTLTIPQIPAQNFKGGINQLRPASSELSHTGSQFHYSSGEKSLLDSYTPSLLIAARDTERYRERPLHLESGFLPSKGSFAHSYNQKRKSE